MPFQPPEEDQPRTSASQKPQLQVTYVCEDCLQIRNQNSHDISWSRQPVMKCDSDNSIDISQNPRIISNSIINEKDDWGRKPIVDNDLSSSNSEDQPHINLAKNFELFEDGSSE